MALNFYYPKRTMKEYDCSSSIRPREPTLTRKLFRKNLEEKWKKMLFIYSIQTAKFCFIASCMGGTQSFQIYSIEITQLFKRSTE